MFDRYLIVSASCLLTACTILPYAPAPYAPTPEMLGATPATLKIKVMDKTSNVSDAAVSIARHEVICQKPGETKATITPLGYTENTMRNKLVREEPYSVQLPGNQRILVYSYFIKDYFLQGRRECNVAFSFVPEPGATYLMERDSYTSFFNMGECSAGILKVVATENGETVERLKDYRWGPIQAFPNERFICDEHGNYTLKPPPPPKKKRGYVVKKTKRDKKAENEAEQ